MQTLANKRELEESELFAKKVIKNENVPEAEKLYLKGFIDGFVAQRETKTGSGAMQDEENTTLPMKENSPPPAA